MIVMRKTIIMPIVAVICLVAMQSCHRNYKVNYARVPLDTLQHNDVDSAEEEEIDEMELDIYEIPKNITARDVMDRSNRKAAKEAERLYGGGE